MTKCRANEVKVVALVSVNISAIKLKNIVMNFSNIISVWPLSRKFLNYNTKHSTANVQGAIAHCFGLFLWEDFLSILNARHDIHWGLTYINTKKIHPLGPLRKNETESLGQSFSAFERVAYNGGFVQK